MWVSCQTCHLRAVTGQGCNKNGAPIRTDLPLHDMTGGNYWMPDAILHQNANGTLRLGGGMTATQIEATQAGKIRAQQQLKWAASLSVNGNNLKVTNLTGHKLISGYPEGRRMWLNIKWYDSGNNMLREDGRYGTVNVNIGGTSVPVKTILDLSGTNIRIYEAHYAMTQEWANQLLGLGYSPDMALSYDRVTGVVDKTLLQLASQSPGTYHKTFHFVLNNHVAKDNRIPTYGMTYEEARKRNALPVPANQYGPTNGIYNYWDIVSLNPPAGAVYATIDLLYQTTSWEYIQFLYLANNRTNAFLKDEGVNLLNTWLATGMSEPFVMASAVWGTPPAPTCVKPGGPQNLIATAGKRSIALKWIAGTPAPTTGYRVYYDQAGKLQFVANISAGTLTYTDTGLRRNTQYCYRVTAWNDCNGNGIVDAGEESVVSNQACGTAQ